MRKSCRLPGPLAFTGVRLMEITSRILKNKKRNRLEQGFSNFKMPTSYLVKFMIQVEIYTDQNIKYCRICLETQNLIAIF